MELHGVRNISPIKSVAIWHQHEMPNHYRDILFDSINKTKWKKMAQTRE